MTEIQTSTVPAEPGFNAIFVHTAGREVTALIRHPIVAWIIRTSQTDSSDNLDSYAQPVWVDFEGCHGHPLAIEYPNGEFIFPDGEQVVNEDDAVEYLEDLEVMA